MTEATGVPIVTVPPAIKPGWKTTEGWLAFLAACLGAATTTHLVGDGSPVVVLGGLALTAVSTALHSWGRATVKAAAS